MGKNVQVKVGGKAIVEKDGKRVQIKVEHVSGTSVEGTVVTGNKSFSKGQYIAVAKSDVQSSSNPKNEVQKKYRAF